MLYISPRKPKSAWSKLNKERVEKLMQQGLMTQAGLAVIEAAKQDGSWDSYDAIETVTLPPDFQQALACEEQWNPKTTRRILLLTLSARQAA